MKIIYVADDGKEFDDKYDCEDYEWGLSHPNLKNIKMYNENGILLKNIMSENVYHEVETIIVPNNQCAQDLRDFGRYAGFCAYEDIISGGVWLFDKNSKSFILKQEEL